MTKGQGGAINLVWISQSRPGEQGMRRAKMHNSNLDELGANTQMLNVYVKVSPSGFLSVSLSVRLISVDRSVLGHLITMWIGRDQEVAPTGDGD